MTALIVTVLAGGMVGWLCRRHVWRALALSVLVSAACFGVAWWLKGESQEILFQWMESQIWFQMLAYTLGFLLPCAGSAAMVAALYRNAHSKEEMEAEPTERTERTCTAV